MNLPPHDVPYVHSSATGGETMLDGRRGETHHQRMGLRRKIRSSFTGVDLGLLLAQLVAARTRTLAARRGVANRVVASCVGVRVQSLEGYGQLLLQALLLYRRVRLAARQHVPILLIVCATGLQARLLMLRRLLTLVFPVLLVLLFMLHFMLATVVRKGIVRGIVSANHTIIDRIFIIPRFR